MLYATALSFARKCAVTEGCFCVVFVWRIDGSDTGMAGKSRSGTDSPVFAAERGEK